MNHIKTADFLGELLDNRFSVAGIRFGIDPLLNFLPIGGSTIGLLLAMYIVWIAYREGVPVWTLQKMVVYVAADFIVGLIPFIGWLGDFFVRANLRNLKLLHDYVDGKPLEGKIIAETKALPA